MKPKGPRPMPRKVEQRPRYICASCGRIYITDIRAPIFWPEVLRRLLESADKDGISVNICQRGRDRPTTNHVCGEECLAKILLPWVQAIESASDLADLARSKR